MNNFESKLGIDRSGVKRGSRFVPLLVLVGVVVAFGTYAIELPQSDVDKNPPPDIELVDFNHVNPDTIAPDGSTRNKVLIVRERSEGDDQEERWSFQFWDVNGLRFSTMSESDLRDNLKYSKLRKLEFERRLSQLKADLSSFWHSQEGIPREIREHVRDEVEFITDCPLAREANVLRYVTSLPLVAAKQIVHDFPLLGAAQLKRMGFLLLLSVVPGVLGMIYRRAFWTWFAGAFLILWGINWACDANGLGTMTNEVRDRLAVSWTDELFLNLEILVVVMVIVFRLRRHSAEATDLKTRIFGGLWGGLMILLAVGWSYGMDVWFESSGWHLGSIALLVLLGVSILGQSFQRGVSPSGGPKNIVVCLDGTWNEPGTRDFGYLAETNVFKLFQMLKGAPPLESRRKRCNANRVKEYLDGDASLKQIAFYYHGVGNRMENSQLGQLFGGAFGMGAAAIVERAYMDIVRVYRPGDRIFVCGFSRGAALARLVAGTLGSRGIPSSLWTLRLFGRHWLVWKSARKIQHEQTKDREERGLSSDDVVVDVLGCWDTVGAFGISKNILGIPFQKINLLKDLSVALCVKRAYHMLALDEMRDSFEPSLMDPDPTDPSRIVELWFSGNHSNIGGGYATDKLSDVTFDFWLRHVSSGYAHASGQRPGDERWGIYLDAAKKGIDCPLNDRTVVINPDVLGQLRQSSGGPYHYQPRQLPIRAVIDDSVFERMKKAVPVYAPQSLFNLNEDVVKKRKAIEKEIEELVDPSLGSEERENIRNWCREKLTLTKWSAYCKTEVDPRGSDRRCELGTLLRPEFELANNPRTAPAASRTAAVEGSRDDNR